MYGRLENDCSVFDQNSFLLFRALHPDWLTIKLVGMLHEGLVQDWHSVFFNEANKKESVTWMDHERRKCGPKILG